MSVTYLVESREIGDLNWYASTPKPIAGNELISKPLHHIVEIFLATTELFIESGNVYIETKRNVDPYIAFLMHPCVVVWREDQD